VNIQEKGSGTSLNYESSVRSLKELEEDVEKCNSIHLSPTYHSSMLGFGILFLHAGGFFMNAPKLEVTKELIELVMRINRDCITIYILSGVRVLGGVYKRFLTTHGIMTSQI
jgi:hypothetical protein